MSAHGDSRIVAALARAVELGEIGVQVAACLGERVIVDDWVGEADQFDRRAVDADTLFPVFSIAKAVTATALHLQVERGVVNYDRPVATYWPEFAKNGKDVITVRDVLTHRAGIPQMPEGVTPEEFGDWERMISHLEKSTPLFPPGTQSTYLAYTFGWLVGEIVRRTDPKRRSFRAFVREELLQPLGIRDFFLGVPATEESRVATLYPANYGGPRFDASPYRAMATPPQIAPKPLVFNRPDVRRACIPGANGIATARATARFFAMLANRGRLGDVRLLAEHRVLSFCQPRTQVDEVDQVLGHVVLIGMGSFWLGGKYPPAEPAVGEGRHVLCIAGGGQTVAWADLDTGLSAAICHNRMFSNQPPLAPEVHPFAQLGQAIRQVAGDILDGQ